MNAKAERWSEHKPVQPNSANAVPETAEAAAEFFRCVTYRCGMMGQACAARYQRRAAGPVLGQIDNLNGCNGCEAGRFRAILLEAAPGTRVKRVGIAPPTPRGASKFQPVLATRADPTFGSSTALPDPCSACNAPRDSLSKKRAEGPYGDLCAECERKIRYRAKRADEAKARARLNAWIAEVVAAAARLSEPRANVARAGEAAAAGMVPLRELLAKPIVLPPVICVPDERSVRAKAIARGIRARRDRGKAEVEAVRARLTPQLPDPLPPCSKCGNERFFVQKGRNQLGDPTACSRCNRHVYRAQRRRDRYDAKIEALKARLAAAQEGKFEGCPRCLRVSRRRWDRVGTPLEHFCSDCVAAANRFAPGADAAGLAAWLCEHPSRRDHGSPCRGCGAMRHCAGKGINGEWCSRCTKNAANTVRWHGMELTEDTMHQQLLRMETRKRRAQKPAAGRVAEAVTAATTEAVADASQGRAVYFDPTLLAFELSQRRAQERAKAVEFWAHREGEYLVREAG